MTSPAKAMRVLHHPNSQSYIQPGCDVPWLTENRVLRIRGATCQKFTVILIGRSHGFGHAIARISQFLTPVGLSQGTSRAENASRYGARCSMSHRFLFAVNFNVGISAVEMIFGNICMGIITYRKFHTVNTAQV